MAGILAVAGALVLLERSSLVALAEVEVTGAQRLSAEEVRAAAALPLGTSTLRVDLGAAERRVEELPLVADASLSRRDPLTVRIDVEERVPALTVRGRAGPALVDAEGVVLGAGAMQELPTIVVRTGVVPSPGQSVSANPALGNAHAAYRRLPGPLRAEVVTYVADGSDELFLELARGSQVRFGRAERVDEKARALGAVLEDLGDRAPAAIDVRAPMTPTVAG